METEITWVSKEGLLTQLEMVEGRSGNPQPWLIDKPIGKLLWEKSPLNMAGLIQSTLYMDALITTDNDQTQVEKTNDQDYYNDI